MDSKKHEEPLPPPQNSVRMEIDKLTALFDELERRQPQGQTDLRRTHVRWPFRHAAVRVAVCHVGGSQATFHVACRNISSGGMSILHSSFLHTGTRIITTLPHVSGHNVEVEGSVARCVHIQGLCHEIGIKFKSVIDARNFVKMDMFGDAFVLERVNPDTLQGAVIYVTDSVMEQSLLRHFLRDTRVRLRVAATFDEARTLLEEPADLLICDYVVAKQSGVDFLSSLRGQGQTIPAIIVTADTSDSTREKLGVCEANAFLSKPLEQTKLLRALAEFMSADKDVGNTISSLPRNHPNRPMLDRFVSEVHAQAIELEAAVKDANMEHARNVVLQIAGVAPIMGFPKLAQIAQAADRALTGAQSVQCAAPIIRQLIRNCRDVRLKAA